MREIAPEADPATRNFDVRITLENADASAKFGMTAGVLFPAPATASAGGVIVPSRAVTASNGKSQVWVLLENNTVHARDVQTGAFREDGVVITSGLHAGETIAVAGVHTLTENQLVRPVLETQP